MGVKIGLAVLLVAVGVRLGSDPLKAGSDRNLTPQKTTKDKIFSKEQATRGGELYVKSCEHCHTPEKVPAGKKPGPPVKGDKFFEVWSDRPVGELYGSILNTMPSDGSMVLTSDQTLDLIAYILQINGMPEGTAPLKNDETMKTTVIIK
jgi:cytochrome c5